jgi:hypothetical protein
MAVTINASTSAGLVQTADTSGVLQLQTNSGTTALTIDTSQNATFTGQATIPTINLTGGQITFPATQSASADANTLDDYEEGTFTPTFISATVTYAQQVGHYTKIGNMVYFYLHINISALTRSGTQVNIGGLPFTVGTDPTNEYYVPMSVFTQNGFNQTAATQGYSPLVVQGSTTISFYGQANATSNNYIATTYNDLQTGTNWVRLAGFYKVT